VKRCGCVHTGQECGLGPDESQIVCLEPDQSKLGVGERCTRSADCVVGHECTVDRVCSPYCTTDADCASLGKCTRFINPATGEVVPGANACTRECDLFSGASCKAGTACYAESGRRGDWATCRYLYDDTPSARGEVCDYYNECSPTLVCAEYGPRVCTSFCRNDSDCPAATPHCFTAFLRPMTAAPGETVGHCVAWPCDEASVGAPPAWIGGPVWTEDQALECKTRCGPNRSCWRLNCVDGERWAACVDASVKGCVGSLGGPCRAEYVALTCSDYYDNAGPERAFEDCAERQADCIAEGESACGSSWE